MKSNQLILAALMMFGGLFVACDDNNGGNDGGGANSEAKVVADDYEAWTYFDFETGTTQTLPINKEEGAVTGLYTGTLKGSGMFADYVDLEDVSVSITRVNADSVEVSAMDLTMSMSGEEGDPGETDADDGDRNPAGDGAAPHTAKICAAILRETKKKGILS